MGSSGSVRPMDKAKSIWFSRLKREPLQVQTTYNDIGKDITLMVGDQYTPSSHVKTGNEPEHTERTEKSGIGIIYSGIPDNQRFLLTGVKKTYFCITFPQGWMI